MNSQEQEYSARTCLKSRKVEEKAGSKDQVKEYQIMERIDSGTEESPMHTEIHEMDTLMEPQLVAEGIAVSRNHNKYNTQ